MGGYELSGGLGAGFESEHALCRSAGLMLFVL